MITTNTTAAYDNYTTYGGTFYAGGRVTAKDLTTTQTFTYDFPRETARKETSMFTTDVLEFQQDEYQGIVRHQGKIVAVVKRRRKTRDKALADARAAADRAVSALFENDDQLSFVDE